MRIGFDFDGTLAVWPRGFQVRYDDATAAMVNAAAVLGTIKWLKASVRQGHEVIVITGRDALHHGHLRYWLFQFTGNFIDVITRPNTVGLDVMSQAMWKAQVIQDLDVDVYVGDNPRIDQEAARIAGVRFIDAGRLRRGELPPLPAVIRA
jgi:acid phosphatase class B